MYLLKISCIYIMYLVHIQLISPLHTTFQLLKTHLSSQQISLLHQVFLEKHDPLSNQGCIYGHQRGLIYWIMGIRSFLKINIIKFQFCDIFTLLFYSFHLIASPGHCLVPQLHILFQTHFHYIYQMCQYNHYFSDMLSFYMTHAIKCALVSHI